MDINKEIKIIISILCTLSACILYVHIKYGEYALFIDLGLSIMMLIAISVPLYLTFMSYKGRRKTVITIREIR